MATLTCGSGEVAGSGMVGTDPFMESVLGEANFVLTFVTGAI